MGHASFTPKTFIVCFT